MPDDDGIVDLTNDSDDGLPPSWRSPTEPCTNKRPLGGGGASAAAGGPSHEVLVIDDVDHPCDVCSKVEADTLHLQIPGCGHRLCQACLTAAANKGLAACVWPLRLAAPAGAAAVAPSPADFAFAAWSCPKAKCSALLSAKALEKSELSSSQQDVALRWMAACLDATAAGCASAGASGRSPSGPKGGPKSAAAAKGDTGKWCATCGKAVSMMMQATGHVCLPEREHSLALAKHAAALRDAHWAPGGCGGTVSTSGAKRLHKSSAAAGAPKPGSGVGYGGATGAPTKAMRAAVAKAQDKERAADAATAAALSAMAGAVDALPSANRMTCFAAAALAHGGAVPALRAWLRTASLFEAATRGEVFTAALSAVRSFAGRNDTLGLLCIHSSKTTQDVPLPGRLQGPLPAGEGGAAGDAQEEEDDGDDDGGRTLLDELREVASQAEAVLAASASAGARDEVSALAQQLVDAYKLLCQRSRAAGVKAPNKRRRLAAAAAAAAAGGGGGAASAAAAVEAEYQAIMSPQCFDSSPLLQTHYFRKEAPPLGVGGEAGKQRMRRIAREAAAMRSGLPCHFGSAVALRVDDERPDVMQAMIVPHGDTPYGNGVFIFDILLPGDYPNSPPKVQLLTTGGGRVRFNPNLYAEGKVCLSLLGTWKGPSWDPATSTLLQVLVSIQSLIFVEKPWFNEPGFERTEGTPEGERNSEAYNAQCRADTLQWALLPALRSPPPAFNAFLVQHFRRKHDDIKRQLDEWSAFAKRGAVARGPHVTSGDSARQLVQAAAECGQALQRYAPAKPSRGPIDTVVID